MPLSSDERQVACCRFPVHRDRVFQEAGGARWRRKFSREFKIEAVRLVRERGVSVAQASRDIDVHENVLRKWVKEFGAVYVMTWCTRVPERPARRPSTMNENLHLFSAHPVCHT